MLGLDLLLIALLCVSAGTTIGRLWYLPAAIWGAGAMAVVLLTQSPPLPYAASQLGGLVALILIFARRRQRTGA